MYDFLNYKTRYYTVTALVVVARTDTPVEDENKFRLKQFRFKEGDTFNYLYDFGDDWHHAIQVIKIEESDLDFPVCVYGDRACPPEDCGGIRGYHNLVEIINDPTHSEYESLTTWLPDNYDPKIFPIEEVNEELAKFGAWHQKASPKKIHALASDLMVYPVKVRL